MLYKIRSRKIIWKHKQVILGLKYRRGEGGEALALGQGEQVANEGAGGEEGGGEGGRRVVLGGPQPQATHGDGELGLQPGAVAHRRPEDPGERLPRDAVELLECAGEVAGVGGAKLFS